MLPMVTAVLLVVAIFGPIGLFIARYFGFGLLSTLGFGLAALILWIMYLNHRNIIDWIRERNARGSVAKNSNDT